MSVVELRLARPRPVPEDPDSAAWLALANTASQALTWPGLSDECRHDLECMVSACHRAARRWQA